MLQLPVDAGLTQKGTTMKSVTTTLHFQLNDKEHAAISEAKRNGAHFERPEMLCQTGDGHAEGTRNWDNVTCGRCLQTGKTWRKYNGEQQ